MITIPVSNPTRAKLITAATGITLVVVARFLPGELNFVRELLTAAGLFPVGVAAAQIVRAPS